MFQRDVMTGLKFWFWLLVLGLLLVPVYLIMAALYNAGMQLGGPGLGTGYALVLLLMGVGAFVLVLFIHGWIINHRIRGGG